MKPPKRLPLLSGLLIILAVAAAVAVMTTASSRAKPPPSAPGYYTGPMVNKSGTLIVTDEGKIVGKVNKENEGASPALATPKKSP